MKTFILPLIAFLLPLPPATSVQAISATDAGDGVMSKAYREIWNAEEQARIDRDIDLYRKARAVLTLRDAAPNTQIHVEQLTHDFIFGASIFNFDQLGKTEYNQKYKALFGTLFNSATIAFYWKTFEMEPGKPRFKGEFRDTEAYWNEVTLPKREPHWRRPATDPIVDFCEAKGIRAHGHPICWGIRLYHHPEWLIEQFCPADEKQELEKISLAELQKMSPDDIEKLAPVFAREMNRLFEKRARELAAHYQGRVQSWDIVNESATDFGRGRMIPGKKISISHYGLMPGDYARETFVLADEIFPKDVVFNINDYVFDKRYMEQVKDLLGRGCRIDIMGSQVHLLQRDVLPLSKGERINRWPVNSPQQIRDTMALLGQAGRPIHLSEVTVAAMGHDEESRQMQAVMTRNLYRAWFSIEPMMGITWWNVVDDCGTVDSPYVGLLTRDMKPKPAFHALDQLINGEWKTRLSLDVGADGAAGFRGFKGKYRVSYNDVSGHQKVVEFHLSKDGDGI